MMSIEATEILLDDFYERVAMARRIANKVIAYIPDPDYPITEVVVRDPKSTHSFQIGDLVSKIKGSCWTGRVVGTYSTALTPEGYAVESRTETGSVQIYPASALILADGSINLPRPKSSAPAPTDLISRQAAICVKAILDAISGED
jgi:R67 dihydrofolate reductase